MEGIKQVACATAGVLAIGVLMVQPGEAAPSPFFLEFVGDVADGVGDIAGGIGDAFGNTMDMMGNVASG